LAKKILIIEDEAAIRDNLRRLLVLEGYAVTAEANGALGLKRALAEPPDLILCDVMMPEMNGFEVLAALRSSPPLVQMPFIFLTASADKDSIAKGISLGAADYVTKPFDLPQLAALVRRRLGAAD
jgi:CheY-like chemotaxis protein